MPSTTMFQATPEIRTTVLERLHGLESELKGFGIRNMSLYGSIAKATGDSSDVDLAITLVQAGSAAASDLAHIAERLTAVLGYQADIVVEPVGDDYLQAKIDKYRIAVF